MATARNAGRDEQLPRTNEISVSAWSIEIASSLAPAGTHGDAGFIETFQSRLHGDAISDAAPRRGRLFCRVLTHLRICRIHCSLESRPALVEQVPSRTLDP